MNNGIIVTLYCLGGLVSFFVCLEVATEALKHISYRDTACSPCNGRSDYDVSEHDQNIAKEALKRFSEEK